MASYQELTPAVFLAKFYKDEMLPWDLLKMFILRCVLLGLCTL
jgi:hypothetical protein